MDLFEELDRDSLQNFGMKVELGEWYTAFTMDNIRKFQSAFEKVIELKKEETLYPPISQLYKAYRSVAPHRVKVVILGQDPYSDGQATGLAFATTSKLNPSLKAINDAMKTYHNPPTYKGKRKLNLEYLSTQGVLLLNTKLAVRANAALSVNEVNWNELTLATIKLLNDKYPNIVWMLWGRVAMEYAKYVTNVTHSVLHFEHPAAAMRENREWQCDHFRRANIFFVERGIEPIHWT